MTPVNEAACATAEYASIRLTSVWVMAVMVPTIIVTIAMAQQHRLPVQAYPGHRDVEDPQHRAECRYLRARRHEGRDRCGRALVHVGNPRVERHRTDFEQQSDGDQRGADEGQPGVGAMAPMAAAIPVRRSVVVAP